MVIHDFLAGHGGHGGHGGGPELTVRRGQTVEVLEPEVTKLMKFMYFQVATLRLGRHMRASFL